MKKRAADPARYRLFLKPSVHRARKQLPGNVRHRIGRGIDGLAQDPRPAKSRQLRLAEDPAPDDLAAWEVRRLRVESYRIVYAISEAWKEVAVLAVEKRPPYDYDDLERLVADLISDPP